MRRTAIPLFVLILLIGAMTVVQYRWLTELARAERVRMERDLRVSLQATTGTLDLELLRRGPTIASMDSARAGRLARGAVDTGLDSAWLADTLLPVLARQIATNAELEVTLALVGIQGTGDEKVLARTGTGERGTPDATAPIFAGGGTQRLLFMPKDGAERDRMAVATWTAEAKDSTVARNASTWELRAWHAAGSVEQATERLRRRNLAVSFGLMALLAAAGVYTLSSWHRSRRLAEDRVTILAGISHEARTPLAVIRSAADNLAGGVVVAPSDVVEYGRLIETESERLTSVVEGALAFARVADGGTRSTERFNLGAVVTETVQECEAPSRVVVSGGEVWHLGDRHAIGTAIRNLLANALAYSPPDSVVELGVEQRPHDIEVVVADRGPGIPAKERRRVFEAFQRGPTGTTAGRAGLGLGLTLASRVARFHGGELLHRDREGGGSVFVLRLPLAT
jgi:signal transduction histidine kinase